MKKLLFVLSLFITSFSFGQNLQNANWCFGFNAGVNFNSTPTPFWSATPTTPIYNYGAGEASVSDDNGILQFYTDGLTVWNRNHAIMPNGEGLFGFSDLPDLQKVVIIPKPNHPKIYYVFTLGLIYKYQFGAPAFGRGGIHYTIVDMTTGLGQVDPVLKNISLLNHNEVAIDYLMDYTYSSPVHITEHSRMTTSLHANGDKIWLSFMADYEQFNSGNHQRFFYNYLVTENGIIYGSTGNAVPDGTSPKPTVAILLDNANYPAVPSRQYTGVMKISPNGQFLSDAEEGAVNLYTYNKQTGNIVLPAQTIYTATSQDSPGFGLEFSPNSGLVYFSDMLNGIMQEVASSDKSMPAQSIMTNYYTKIYQYNIQNQELQVIYIYPVVAEFNSNNLIIPIAPNARPCGLQLGIDNRIYVTNIAQPTYMHDRLGIIQFPNTVGINCGFNPNGLLLTPVPNTFHNSSLPQWVHKAEIITAPTGLWVWMHGDNVVNQTGVYGTQGVPSPSNKPGSRYNVMSWGGPSGDLWLFGGTLDPGMGAQFMLDANDLWKYNVSTNQWTWMKGSNVPNQLSVNGTLGVPNNANTPGARMEGITWVDASGNLWLYGGEGKSTYGPSFYALSDLWKYDISTNQWTWVNGASTFQWPNYGTQGVPSPTNHPGSRFCALSWVDPVSGNLWMFGGSGSFVSDELWKYDISTNQWTWMRDNNTGANYGVKGVPAMSNHPGGRVRSICWTDASGNFWLFGGEVSDAPITESLNDLWKYNINTNMWTWMSGDNIINQTGVYGTKNVQSPTNKPGSRYWSLAWSDVTGNNLFLFGGAVYGLGYANDLWQYNIPSNQWTWVSGDNVGNTPGIYGALGVGSPITKPGARLMSRASWRTTNGTLWLFGGYGVYPTNQVGRFNDLWKYTGNCTGPSCFTDKSNKSESFLNRSLQNNPVIPLNKNEEVLKPVLSNIQSLEIYNAAGQLVKKINSDIDSYEVLRNNKANGLIPGLYFVRVIYKDKTSKTIKQFLQ